MSIVAYTKDNIPKIERQIDSGHTASVYLTKDRDIFKVYDLEDETSFDYYDSLIEYHNYEYLKYLYELSQLDVSNLVVPKDIYVKDNSVRAYTYEYQIGNRIDQLYPKTSLDKLFCAIDRLFDTIQDIDYLKMFDMHQMNIIYTGEIQLIDLDFCKLEHVNPKENIANINHGLIHGILDIDINNKIIAVIKSLSSSYRGTLSGDVRASDFLREYIDYLGNNNVRYIRDLSKKLIIEGNEKDKRRRR